MSGDFATGFAAALGAAVLYGGAPVVQARVARTVPPGRGAGFGLVLRLLRHPLWLVALVGEFGAFLVEAYAFSAAPTTLVAPVASCDMLVFVLGGCLVFRYRPSLSGVAGAAGVVVGIVALALAVGEAELGRPASSLAMLLLAALAVAAAVASVLVGRRLLDRPTAAAIAFSAGAGVAYGVATLATRQIGRTFSFHALGSLLASPTPYVLIGASVLAIALLQRGLQTSPIITFPIVSALSALIPLIVGLVFLDEPAPPGFRRLVLAVGLVLILAGLGLMARDRLRAEHATA